LNPNMIIADEPVSALDVSIQAQIINLLKELQKTYQITIVFISHDLRVVRYITERVVVMYLGKIVEIAETEELYNHPLHPYTQILLQSNPNLDPRKRTEKALIEGEPPSPINLPIGCRFHARCKGATDKCSQSMPELREIKDNHQVACHYAERYMQYTA
ncbi:MAG: oligopeptide/dipeptide ABC transporter ATP-binding protein, partial [Lachnospiraceae bacterium]